MKLNNAKLKTLPLGKSVCDGNNLYFTRTGDAKGKFTFRYSDGFVSDPDPYTDRAVLESGRISRSLLDFSQIGKRN